MQNSEHVSHLNVSPSYEIESRTEATTSFELGRQYKFRFKGTASEYFGIWIVNILLTIITLGLYAPWAKVRRLRYFYGNTWFIQRRFDFTGLPTKILVGRLIALAIYGAFTLAMKYSASMVLVGFVLIFLAIPWQSLGSFAPPFAFGHAIVNLVTVDFIFQEAIKVHIGAF